MNDNLVSYDPSNNDRLGDVVVSSRNDIEKMVGKAKEAAKIWRSYSIQERLEYLKRAYKSVEPFLQELSVLLSREMGKDIRRAMGEVQGTVYGGPYIGESAAQALASYRTGRTEIQYAPLGVVAVISPWNYPLAMANNLIVPSLIAGNTVVWKPSEQTPLVAQHLYDHLAGVLPENTLQIAHGDGEQGHALVDSDVDMIAFTGSQEVGKEIMRHSSGTLKRLVMELGGNDPMLVLKDADVNAAARFAVASSFENSGQMCTSTERIYVHESRADEFEKLAVQYAEQYKVGAWDIDGVNIGPINNAEQHVKISSHINDAMEKGAKLLLGDEHPVPPYVHPTVITDMDITMKIEQEETFGPLVCISRFTDLEDAIHRANNTTYGLGAVVFGQNDVEAVAGRLEAGMIGINQGVGGEGDSPWVGAKQSGFGFHGSADGHRQFAQVRVINN